MLAASRSPPCVLGNTHPVKCSGAMSWSAAIRLRRSISRSTSQSVSGIGRVAAYKASGMASFGGVEADGVGGESSGGVAGDFGGFGGVFGQVTGHRGVGE